MIGSTRKGSTKMFREIKYWIADKLFEYELDEAFRMGVSEGMRIQGARVRVQLQLRQDLDLTKAQLAGYEKAREVVADVTR